MQDSKNCQEKRVKVIQELNKAEKILEIRKKKKDRYTTAKVTRNKIK